MADGDNKDIDIQTAIKENALLETDFFNKAVAAPSIRTGSYNEDIPNYEDTIDHFVGSHLTLQMGLFDLSKLRNVEFDLGKAKEILLQDYFLVQEIEKARKEQGKEDNTSGEKYFIDLWERMNAKRVFEDWIPFPKQEEKEE